MANALKIPYGRFEPHIRLIHLDDKISSERFFVPRRMIYDYEMYYIIDGSVDCVFDDRTIRLTKGDVHFMPPFVWHKRVVCEGCDCTYYSIHFDLKYVETEDFDKDVYINACLDREDRVAPDESLMDRTIFQPEALEFPLQMKVAEDLKLYTLLNEMNGVFNDRSEAGELMLKGNFLKVLYLIFRQLEVSEHADMSVANTELREIVLQVCKYFEDNLSQKIVLGNLARQFGLSAPYLREAFHHNTSMSPLAYLNNMRIEKAKVQLLTKRKSVKDIALGLGFKNIQTFSRMFKNKTQLSPREYASRYAAKK